MRSSFLWNPSGLRETQLGGLLFVFGNWRRCSRSQATSITTVVFSNLAWCTYLAPGHLGPLHPCLGLQPGSSWVTATRVGPRRRLDVVGGFDGHFISSGPVPVTTART